MMIPEIENEEDVKLLHYLQERTPLTTLFEKYGGKSNYYFKRDQLIKKYNITFKSNIFFPQLGLTRYFVLGKHLYRSPYLVQSMTYYLPHIRFLSQFALPRKFEQQFIEQLVNLDQEVEVYQAEELALPHYNFEIFLDKSPHERRLWRWMALLQKEVFPDLPESKFEYFKFDRVMLNILYYKTQRISGVKIMEEIGITDRKTYDKMEKSLGSIYQEVVSVNSIEKLLFIINHPLEKFDLLTLVKSFYELFIYCHPYQISKIYPRIEDEKNSTGILCILMPPTPHIPLFHHTICDLLETHCFLAIIDAPLEYFELQKVYNQADESWEWDGGFISLSK